MDYTKIDGLDDSAMVHMVAAYVEERLTAYLGIVGGK